MQLTVRPAVLTVCTPYCGRLYERGPDRLENRGWGRIVQGTGAASV